MSARSSGLKYACLAMLACGSVSGVQAQSDWTAANSDPNLLGWMRGSPPPRDKIINLADGRYFHFPQMRWTVCHFRDLMPTQVVARGTGSPAPWPVALNPAIGDVSFDILGTGQKSTIREALSTTFADGLIVIHEGKIVFEHYSGCLKPGGWHGAMSLTKSMIGLLAEILIAEGKIDPLARVDHYVPELAVSAFGDATIRQVMDMTTALVFSEAYADPKAEIWQHAAAGNPLPKPDGYLGPRSYHEFLVTVKKNGVHGDAFGYRTVNTDVLGWIVSRVAGMPVTQLLSERIWKPMGAETDGYMSIDSVGTPFAGGGLSASLRDLARVGLLLLNDGKSGPTQIFPASVAQSIRNGGSKDAFAKAGYAQLTGCS